VAAPEPKPAPRRVGITELGSWQPKERPMLREMTIWNDMNFLNPDALRVDAQGTIWIDTTYRTSRGMAAHRELLTVVRLDDGFVVCVQNWRNRQISTEPFSGNQWEPLLWIAQRDEDLRWPPE